MEFSAYVIFIGAALLVISIMASVVSSRLGAPMLLLFLLLGMVAGDRSLGGIAFSNFHAANLIGNIALAVILFDGGLRTHISDFRVGLRPALSLATVGVLLTTLITGSFAAWILHLHWLQGLLVGAMVASTDASAVFSLMHQNNLELKQRIAATLEIESGSNDPMAVFLTVSIVELLASGQASPSWDMLGMFVLQMGLGALVGIYGGRLLAWTINRMALQTSLYPLLAVSGAALLFGGTAILGGSGFLAIYLAGVVVGNRELQARQNILRVNDGFAWLASIGMFLMLGLLVTPEHLFPVGGQALLIALVLILVARPLAVAASLLPFRFPWRDQAFIAWVGLRGAVPIVLATFPLIAHLPGASLYFNVIFFVVLVSLVLQGWTMAFAARRLQVEVPPRPQPARVLDMDLPGHLNFEMLGYRLTDDCLAVSQPAGQIPLPEHARLATIVRGGEILGADVRQLLPGDYVFIATRAEQVETLNKLFATPKAPTRMQEKAFFGDFVLNGDARLGDVAMLYNFSVRPEDGPRLLADYIRHRVKGHPVVGDRIALDTVDLTVRAVDGDQITKVGVRFAAAE